MSPSEPGWTDDLPFGRAQRILGAVLVWTLLIIAIGALIQPEPPPTRDVMSDRWFSGFFVAVVGVTLLLGIWRRRRCAGNWADRDRRERQWANASFTTLVMSVFVIWMLLRAIMARCHTTFASSWNLPCCYLLLVVSTACEIFVGRLDDGRSGASSIARWTASESARFGFATVLIAGASLALLEVLIPGVLSPAVALTLAIASGMVGRDWRRSTLFRRALRPADPEGWNAVRDARVSFGLTQAALAERVDATRLTINAVENGSFAPPLPLALALARALGTSVEAIARRGDQA